jgi:hypothetical protein
MPVKIYSHILDYSGCHESRYNQNIRESIKMIEKKSALRYVLLWSGAILAAAAMLPLILAVPMAKLAR